MIGMDEKTALVVTSIAKPNAVLRALAQGCQEKGYQFIVIGDQASPPGFQLDGCLFYDLKGQRETGFGFAFARLCPIKHYARKNIGYLLALRGGAQLIIETDDDNFPYQEFWNERVRRQTVATIADGNWINIYAYFSEANIWPRGLPLEHIKDDLPAFESLGVQEVDCLIQQGLADENPDVDAIYRLISTLPQSFRKDRRIALANNSWCPFNSQNTTWWAEAFPLLYLPAYCSFRMTDIWRSFVAQRIAWLNGWSILFHEPTVWQERNEHNLMRDFGDEVPGYLNNTAIGEALGSLELKSGTEHINENLRVCYEKLVSMSLVGEQELPLLDAWLKDTAEVSKQ